MPETVKTIATGDWVKILKNLDVSPAWGGKTGVIARIDLDESSNRGLPYEVVLPYRTRKGKAKVTKVWFRRSELKRLGAF